jgi:hypothetical protein
VKSWGEGCCEILDSIEVGSSFGENAVDEGFLVKTMEKFGVDSWID